MKSVMENHSPEYEAAYSYDLYVSLHRSCRANPQIFTTGRCTQILTAMMGGRSWSWRVVGITPAALKLFHKLCYKYKPGEGITRAHIVSRSETTKILIYSPEPLEKGEFTRLWIENDRTVLCAKGENKAIMPDFLEFDDRANELFPSKHIAWRHGKEEQEFLKRFAIENGFDN